jgi:nitrogen-specific signal transduction histidine kinase
MQVGASFIEALAQQIENPIQALSNFVENAVQGFVYDVAEQGLTSGRPLDIDISMHSLPFGHLIVSDNGPGIHPSKFRDFMTSCAKPKKL